MLWTKQLAASQLINNAFSGNYKAYNGSKHAGVCPVVYIQHYSYCFNCVINSDLSLIAADILTCIGHLFKYKIYKVGLLIYK